MKANLYHTSENEEAPLPIEEDFFVDSETCFIQYVTNTLNGELYFHK